MRSLVAILQTSHCREQLPGNSTAHRCSMPRPRDPRQYPVEFWGLLGASHRVPCADAREAASLRGVLYAFIAAVRRVDGEGCPPGITPEQATFAANNTLLRIDGASVVITSRSEDRYAILVRNSLTEQPTDSALALLQRKLSE